jgi:hypothetical protein
MANWIEGEIDRGGRSVLEMVAHVQTLIPVLLPVPLPILLPVRKS